MTNATQNEQLYPAGYIIFNEGDVSDSAYVVVRGEVEVYRKVQSGTVLLAVLGAGEIFGEMGVVDDSPRSATVSARTECLVRKIHRSDIKQVLQQQSPEFCVLLRALMERLRQASNQLSALAEKQAGLQLSQQPIQSHPVNRITLRPASEDVQKLMPPQGLVLQSLPYRVGAIPSGEQANPLDWNHLCLEGADTRFMSRNHFSIQRAEGGIVISDRGSPQGTIVNGRPIGAGQSDYRASLHWGENTVIAGALDSPYRFAIIWE